MKNALCVLILFIFSTAAHAVTPISSGTDAIINLPPTSAWKLFTSVDGLTAMGYQQASIQLVLGTHLHAERNTASANDVIDGTITSFDPEHMLSWQWTNKSCWSVLYFNAMGNDMTQIRWLDFCSASMPEKLNQLTSQHRSLFDQLIRHYAPECHVCKEEREATSKTE